MDSTGFRSQLFVPEDSDEEISVLGDVSSSVDRNVVDSAPIEPRVGIEPTAKNQTNGNAQQTPADPGKLRDMHDVVTFDSDPDTSVGGGSVEKENSRDQDDISEVMILDNPPPTATRDSGRHSRRLRRKNRRQQKVNAVRNLILSKHRTIVSDSNKKLRSIRLRVPDSSDEDRGEDERGEDESSSDAYEASSEGERDDGGIWKRRRIKGPELSDSEKSVHSIISGEGEEEDIRAKTSAAVNMVSGVRRDDRGINGLVEALRSFVNPNGNKTRDGPIPGGSQKSGRNGSQNSQKSSQNGSQNSQISSQNGIQKDQKIHQSQRSKLQSQKSQQRNRTQSQTQKGYIQFNQTPSRSQEPSKASQRSQNTQITSLDSDSDEFFSADEGNSVQVSDDSSDDSEDEKKRGQFSSPRIIRPQPLVFEGSSSDSIDPDISNLVFYGDTEGEVQVPASYEHPSSSMFILEGSVESESEQEGQGPQKHQREQQRQDLSQKRQTQSGQGGQIESQETESGLFVTNDTEVSQSSSFVRNQSGESQPLFVRDESESDDDSISLFVTQDSNAAEKDLENQSIDSLIKRVVGEKEPEVESDDTSYNDLGSTESEVEDSPVLGARGQTQGQTQRQTQRSEERQSGRDSIEIISEPENSPPVPIAAAPKTPPAPKSPVRSPTSPGGSDIVVLVSESENEDHNPQKQISQSTNSSVPGPESSPYKNLSVRRSPRRTRY